LSRSKKLVILAKYRNILLDILQKSQEKIMINDTTDCIERPGSRIYPSIGEHPYGGVLCDTVYIVLAMILVLPKAKGAAKPISGDFHAMS
jgi:hypothetical protein